MSRLTISLPDNLHQHLSALAINNNESMSNLINRLIRIGLQHWFKNEDNSRENPAVEQYCHQLIIQMNALIKNMSVEMLKLDKEDLEKLQQAAAIKYSELSNNH
ncbi:hypothetical protein [Legionella brunensis]|uniref:CopG-like ribbon-helix-helix domain-containing protein n=1 Tax=Legionella brunensis TaxID=29422 RepID=A0A0W0SJZ2_9GAMM|nr:hypothetical protein [Legionella brunensis]KTC83703.1 hypothetical protein Lbru_1672 [Legionella brunensis]